jgi:hypothetical protein
VRWVVLFVLLVLFILLVPVIAVALFRISEANANGKKVEEAIARIERDDPEWHWEQIESTREEVPDAKNGGLRVLTARELLPEDWPGKAFTDTWSECPPERLLPPNLSNRLVEELTAHQKAIAEAREVRHYRTGRYPITYFKDYFAVRIPHIMAVKSIGLILEADAVARAEWKDYEGAMESCCACLANGRTLGDEFLLLATSARNNQRIRAAGLLQRILAQGEPSDDALKTLRSQFADESEVRRLERSLRFERGQFHKMFEGIESGELYSGGELRTKEMTIEDKIELFSEKPSYLKGHAQLLHAWTDVIDIVRLPPQEQLDAASAWETRREPMTREAERFMVSLEKVVEMDLRSVALLRCSVAAVNAELFRRKTGHWPIALSDLAAEYPKGLPVDPFDGQPLRLKSLPNSIVIYSVGRDKRDDDGELYRPLPRTVPGQGNDIGLRLWDLEKRRQPAVTAPMP